MSSPPPPQPPSFFPAWLWLHACISRHWWQQSSVGASIPSNLVTSVSARVSVIIQIHSPFPACSEAVDGVLGGGGLMRIFLTLPRHDSCISACLVESGCSFFPFFVPFYITTWVRSCPRALAFVFLYAYGVFHLRVSWVYFRVNFLPSFVPPFILVFFYEIEIL